MTGIPSKESQQANFSPKCGASDQRNAEYENSFTPKKFFDQLVASDNPVIFDVGAHRGESIKFFKAIYPYSKIYTFEPSPDNYSELLKIVEKYCDVYPFNIALGKTDGATPFYKQDITHLGGLLPINKDSKDSLGYARKAKNEKITVVERTLDTFCQDNSITTIDILKIDTQGYEYEVLQGAKNMLKNTSCVTVEISLYDFYTRDYRSPLLNIERIMSGSGFVLWDISKISKNPKNLRTDWIEVVYSKSN